MMQDRYGRTIDYLRLSITDRCNLRCRYCMPDGAPLLAHSDILTYEEFLQVAAAAWSFCAASRRCPGWSRSH